MMVQSPEQQIERLRQEIESELEIGTRLLPTIFPDHFTKSHDAQIMVVWSNPELLRQQGWDDGEIDNILGTYILHDNIWHRGIVRGTPTHSH